MRSMRGPRSFRPSFWDARTIYGLESISSTRLIRIASQMRCLHRSGHFSRTLWGPSKRIPILTDNFRISRTREHPCGKASILRPQRYRKVVVVKVLLGTFRLPSHFGNLELSRELKLIALFIVLHVLSTRISVEREP